MKVIIAILFLLVVSLVIYATGSFDGFTVWNVLPVALGFGVFLIGLRSQQAMAVGCISFGVSVTAQVVLFHLAWLFDWGGTATSSSTSALAFIFVPIWAIVSASIIGLVAWGIGKVIWRRARSASA